MINNLKILYLIPFFCLINANISANTDMIMVPDDLNGDFIGKYISYYEDKNGSLSIDDVISKDLPWKKINKIHYTFGYKPYDVWLRVLVNNVTEKSINFIFEYDYACIDEVYFYSENKQYFFMGGDNLPYDKRPIDHNNPTFLVSQKPGIVSYYFKVKNKGSIQVKIKSWEVEKFIGDKETNFLLIGGYISIMLVLSIANYLFSMFTAKEYSKPQKFFISSSNTISNTTRTSFLLLSLLSLSTLVHSMYYTGLSYQYIFKYIFHIYPELNNKIFCINEVLTNFFMLGICITFEGIKNRLKIQSFLKWLLKINIIFLIIALFMPYYFSIRIVTLYNLFCLTSMTLVGFVIIKTSNTGGKYFGYLIVLFLASAFLEFFWSVGFIVPFSNWFAWGLRSICIGSLSAGVIASGFNQYYIKRNKKEADYLKLLKRMQKTEMEIIQKTAHEFLTPVSTIKMASNQLSKYNDFSEIIQKTINIVNTEASHLHNLTKNYLDVTRSDYKSDKIDFDKHDLKSIVEETLDLLKNFNGKAQYNHKIIFPQQNETGQFTTKVDKENIKIALKNIIQNSIKNTMQHGIIIISLQKNEKSIIVSIIDNGCGISFSEREKIYIPFFQSNNSKNDNSGVGLGLTIVQKIIDLHEGYIKIASPLVKNKKIHNKYPFLELSNERKGTLFEIYLPKKGV